MFQTKRSATEEARNVQRPSTKRIKLEEASKFTLSSELLDDPLFGLVSDVYAFLRKFHFNAKKFLVSSCRKSGCSLFFKRCQELQKFVDLFF